MLNLWHTLDLLAENDLQRSIDGFTSLQYFLTNLSKRNNFVRNKCGEDDDDDDDNCNGTFQGQQRLTLELDNKKCTKSGNSMSGSGERSSKKSVKQNKKSVSRKKRRKGQRNSGTKFSNFGENDEDNGLDDELLNIFDCTKIKTSLKKFCKLKKNIFMETNDRKQSPEKESKNEFEEDILECTFVIGSLLSLSLPEINGKFERLMGSNVVRLTDRNYMKELRERIMDENNQVLLKRIAAREQREIERERGITLERNFRIISQELPSSSPSSSNSLSKQMLLMFNKGNDNEFKGYRKARIKTSHEKNTERLRRLQSKWEKEYNKKIHEKYGDKNFYTEDDDDDDDDDTENREILNVQENKINIINEINMTPKRLIEEKCEQEENNEQKENLCYENSNEKIDEIPTPSTTTTAEENSSNDNRTDPIFDLGNIVIASRCKFRDSQRKHRDDLNEEQIKNGIKFNVVKDLLRTASERSIKSRQMIDEEIRNDCKKMKENEKDNKSEKSQNSDYIKYPAKLKENNIKQSEILNPIFNLPEIKVNPVLLEDHKIHELRKANSVNKLYELAEEIILKEEEEEKSMENANGRKIKN